MSDCVIAVYFLIKTLLPEPEVTVLPQESTLKRCEHARKVAITRAQFQTPSKLAGVPIIDIMCVPCRQIYDDKKRPLNAGLLDLVRKIHQRELKKELIRQLNQ
jgi:hypothetical protein